MKLFQTGGSQAGRLPKDCQAPEDQVEGVVRREDRRIILEPVYVWPDDFVRSLGSWHEEIERPGQVPLRAEIWL